MFCGLNYEIEILNIRTNSVNVVPTKSTKLEIATKHQSFNHYITLHNYGTTSMRGNPEKMLIMADLPYIQTEIDSVMLLSIQKSLISV